MRRNSKINIEREKELARRKYAERQIDKWWKWSWEIKGYIKYKDLVKLQEKYNIKSNG
jgi:hypothetical protein